MTQHPLMLRCLFCGEWHLLYNISPNKQITHQNIHCPSWFLVIMWPLETEMKPPLDLLLIHEEGASHACIQEHNLVECTHVWEEFLPASALKQALPELPVSLNPILKERFTPHVWEAPGIGRECAHKGTCTNTICMPDAMLNQCSKHSYLVTWNGIAVCHLLLVLAWLFAPR